MGLVSSLPMSGYTDARTPNALQFPYGVPFRVLNTPWTGY